MSIISLSPSATEILFKLGLGAQIVGRTRFCDYPTETSEIPVVGGWLDIDYDKIKELNPDIIITSTFLQNDIVKELKSKDYEVLHLDPITLEDVMDSIIKIGERFNKKEQASSIVDNMRSKIISIQSKLLGVKSRPNIYIEEWHKPPNASGNWVTDLLDISKANSILPKGERSKEVSSEELQKFNPEKVIISWCGFGKDIKPELLESLKEREGYNNIDAIKNNDIYVIDDSLLNRPGPRLVEGLEKVTKIAHPEKFKNNSIDNMLNKLSSYNEGTEWHGTYEFED